VFARNLGTGRTVRHRADELFPMCSLFKTLASAAVLRDPDLDDEFPSRRIHCTVADKTGGGSHGTDNNVGTRLDTGGHQRLRPRARRV
jgi:beta-lactamase class A